MQRRVALFGWFLLGAVVPACGNCGRERSPQLVPSEGEPQVAGKLDFGNVAVGETVQLQLPLTNIGTGNLDFDGQTVSAGPFSLPTPFPTTLSPGQHAPATVAFTPTQAGPATGTLTLMDDGQPSQVVIALTGTGLDLNLTVDPASLDFGQVLVGVSPSPMQTVTFTNNNTQPVYISFSTSATASEYAVTDSGGNPVPTSLTQIAVNGTYTVDVTFSPDAASVFNSQFSYVACQDSAGTLCVSPQTVPLAGQGITGLVVMTPDPVGYNGVPSGSSAVQQVTVTNQGAVSVTVSCLYLQSLGSTACATASSNFAFGGQALTLPTTLAAGASFSFPLTYSATGPTANDVLAATYTPQGLTATVTATDPIEAPSLSGPCELSVTPASLIFDPVTVGNAVTETVTLANAGNGDCQITGIAIDGSSDPSYALAAGQATSLTVSSGAPATIGVTFDLNNNSPPSARRGTLDFQSTDPAHGTVNVPLLATQASPYAGGGAWPRWHYDNIQSGLSPVDTSGLAGTVSWTFQVGAPQEGDTDYLNSPVVDSNGTIYQVGVDGILYAITPAGQQAWTMVLAQPGGGRGGGGNDALTDLHPSTPLISNDGTIYVALGEISSGNALYHLSNTGQQLDAIQPLDNGDGYDLPPMLSSGGFVFGGDDRVGPFAFSMSAGGQFNVIAEQTVSRANDKYAAVVGTDGSTYWCSGSTCFSVSPVGAGGGGFALNLGWGNALDALNSSSVSDVALDVNFTGNLMVLLGGGAGYNGPFNQTLASVSLRTGNIAWSVNLPGPANGNAYGGFGRNDASVGNSCPAIGADGTVYVGNFDGLHAVDGSTGQEKPGFPFPTDDDVLTAPAIGGDGTIFFGTAGGTFYAINPDGTQRFKLTAAGRIAGSPAIGPTGTVYFTADDGNVYAVN